MGSFVRPYFRHGILSLDGLLIGIALLAGVVMAGAIFRTETDGQSSQFGTFVGGLRILDRDETLVVFEDGAPSDAAGWSAGARNEDHVGLGAIWLVDPGDATLERHIPLPAETAQATVRLDIVAIDDWALEGLELAVNGRPVLRQRFSSRPDLVEAQETEVLAGEGIILRTELDAPKPLGFGEGEAALDETRLVIEMAVVAPGPDITVTLTPLSATGATAGGTPAWAVDNLIVIAARLP
ncbi:hypothetical protein HKCCSP123_09580 [Rhodobacterales bacterium HKCCSP123]|nr:hypothetical protein [Rhodobacterales bacterium HKCCSP123]